MYTATHTRIAAFKVSFTPGPARTARRAAPRGDALHVVRSFTLACVSLHCGADLRRDAPRRAVPCRIRCARTLRVPSCCMTHHWWVEYVPLSSYKIYTFSRSRHELYE